MSAATTTDIYLQSLGHNSLRAAANALDDDCATECDGEVCDG